MRKKNRNERKSEMEKRKRGRGRGGVNGKVKVCERRREGKI